MATNNDVIKQYTLKFNADIADAKKDIDELEGLLSKGLKDKGLASSIKSQITKITETVNGLKGEIKSMNSDVNKELGNINTKELQNEFNSLNKSVSNSIEGLTKQIDSLKGIINSFQNDNFSGLTMGIEKSFNELKDIMKDTVDSFRVTMDYIYGVMDGSIIIPDLSNSVKVQNVKLTKELVSLKKNIIKELELIKKETEDFPLDDLLSNNSNIGKDFANKLYDSINRALDGIQKLKDNKVDISDIFISENSDYIDNFLPDVGYLNEYAKSLKKVLNKSNAELDKERSKRKDWTSEVKFKYELDDKDNAAILSIISKIQNDVVNRVQKYLNAHSVRIPITYSSGPVDVKHVSDEEIKNEINHIGQYQKQAETLKSKVQKDNEIGNELKFQVKLNTQDAIKNIKDDINRITRELAIQDIAIKVDVKPRQIDSYDVEQEQEKINSMLAINNANATIKGGKFVLEDVAGLATESTLDLIKTILESWNHSGLPGSKQFEESKRQESIDNLNRIKAEGNSIYLSSRNPYGRKLTKKSQDEYETTEMLTAEINMLSKEIDSLNSIIRNPKKRTDKSVLTKSDYYNASYLGADGQRYATFSNGGTTLLSEWQKALDTKFDTWVKSKAFTEAEKKLLNTSDKNITSKEQQELKDALVKRRNEEDFAYFLKSERGRITKRRTNLMHNTELNGVQYRTKSNGSYLNDVLAKSSSPTSEKELYSYIQKQANDIVDASRKDYQIIKDQQELLMEKRSIMNDIVRLEDKQRAEGFLGQEDTDLLAKRYEALKPLVKTYKGDTEEEVIATEKKYHDLIAKQDEMRSKFAKGQLDQNGINEYFSLPQQIENCFESVTDLSSYIKSQLEIVDVVSGTTFIDKQINDKANEISDLASKTRKVIQETWNKYSDVDDAVKSQAQKIRDNNYGPQDTRDPNHRLNSNQSHPGRASENIRYGRDYKKEYSYQMVHSEKEYERNQQEIEKLSHITARLSNLITPKYTTDARGNRVKNGNDYTGLTESEQQLYFQTQRRIQRLTTANYLWDQIRKVNKDLKNSTEELSESEENLAKENNVRRVKVKDLNVAENIAKPYETFLGDVFNANNNVEDALGLKSDEQLLELRDNVQKYVTEVLPNKRRERIEQLNKDIESLEKNGITSDNKESYDSKKSELAKIQQEISDSVARMIDADEEALKVELETELKNLKELEKDNENNKHARAIRNKEKKIETLKSSLSEFRDGRNTENRGIQRREQLDEAINSYSETVISIEQMAKEISDAYDLTKEQYDTLFTRLNSISNKNGINKVLDLSDIKNGMTLSDSNIETLSQLYEKRETSKDNIGWRNYNLIAKTSQYQNERQYGKEIIDDLKTQYGINEENYQLYQDVLDINKQILEYQKRIHAVNNESNRLYLDDNYSQYYGKEFRKRITNNETKLTEFTRSLNNIETKYNNGEIKSDEYFDSKGKIEKRIKDLQTELDIAKTIVKQAKFVNNESFYENLSKQYSYTDSLGNRVDYDYAIQKAISSFLYKNEIFNKNANYDYRGSIDQLTSVRDDILKRFYDSLTEEGRKAFEEFNGNQYFNVGSYVDSNIDVIKSSSNMGNIDAIIDQSLYYNDVLIDKIRNILDSITDDTTYDELENLVLKNKIKGTYIRGKKSKDSDETALNRLRDDLVSKLTKTVANNEEILNDINGAESEVIKAYILRFTSKYAQIKSDREKLKTLRNVNVSDMWDVKSGNKINIDKDITESMFNADSNKLYSITNITDAEKELENRIKENLSSLIGIKDFLGGTKYLKSIANSVYNVGNGKEPLPYISNTELLSFISSSADAFNSEQELLDTEAKLLGITMEEWRTTIANETKKNKDFNPREHVLDYIANNKTTLDYRAEKYRDYVLNRGAQSVGTAEDMLAAIVSEIERRQNKADAVVKRHEEERAAVQGYSENIKAGKKRQRDEISQNYSVRETEELEKQDKLLEEKLHTEREIAEIESKMSNIRALSEMSFFDSLKSVLELKQKELDYQTKISNLNEKIVNAGSEAYAEMNTKKKEKLDEELSNVRKELTQKEGELSLNSVYIKPSVAIEKTLEQLQNAKLYYERNEKEFHTKVAEYGLNKEFLSPEEQSIYDALLSNFISARDYYFDALKQYSNGDYDKLTDEYKQDFSSLSETKYSEKVVGLLSEQIELKTKLYNLESSINKESIESIQKQKTESLRLVDTYEEIARFQKENGFTKEQKEASLGVDYELLKLVELQSEINKQDVNSNRYKELAEEIKNAFSELELFRKEAESVGLIISETTGRAFLSDSTKDKGLVDYSSLIKLNQQQDYSSPFNDLEEEKLRAKYRLSEYYNTEKVNEALAAQREEHKKIISLWNVAGMNEREAELSILVARTNAVLKGRKKLSQEQRSYYQEQLEDLYKIIELENKQGKINLSLNEKGYVAQKVSYSDLKNSPESYLTNRYAKDMFATGDYQVNKVSEYRPATEFTLQNIFSLLRQGVNVFVQNSKAYKDKDGKWHKGKYAADYSNSIKYAHMPNVDLAKDDVWKTYKKSNVRPIKDITKVYNYAKMNDVQRQIVKDYEEVRKRLIASHYSDEIAKKQLEDLKLKAKENNLSLTRKGKGLYLADKNVGKKAKKIVQDANKIKFDKKDPTTYKHYDDMDEIEKEILSEFINLKSQLFKDGNVDEEIKQKMKDLAIRAFKETRLRGSKKQIKGTYTSTEEKKQDGVPRNLYLPDELFEDDKKTSSTKKNQPKTDKESEIINNIEESNKEIEKFSKGSENIAENFQSMTKLATGLASILDKYGMLDAEKLTSKDIEANMNAYKDIIDKINEDIDKFNEENKDLPNLEHENFDNLFGEKGRKGIKAKWDKKFGISESESEKQEESLETIEVIKKEQDAREEENKSDDATITVKEENKKQDAIQGTIDISKKAVKEITKMDPDTVDFGKLNDEQLEGILKKAGQAFNTEPGRSKNPNARPMKDATREKWNKFSQNAVAEINRRELERNTQKVNPIVQQQIDNVNGIDVSKLTSKQIKDKFNTAIKAIDMGSSTAEAWSKKLPELIKNLDVSQFGKEKALNNTLSRAKESISKNLPSAQYWKEILSPLENALKSFESSTKNKVAESTSTTSKNKSSDTSKNTTTKLTSEEKEREKVLKYEEDTRNALATANRKNRDKLIKQSYDIELELLRQIHKLEVQNIGADKERVEANDLLISRFKKRLDLQRSERSENGMFDEFLFNRNRNEATNLKDEYSIKYFENVKRQGNKVEGVNKYISDISVAGNSLIEAQTKLMNLLNSQNYPNQNRTAEDVEKINDARQEVNELTKSYVELFKLLKKNKDTGFMSDFSQDIIKTNNEIIQSNISRLKETDIDALSFEELQASVLNIKNKQPKLDFEFSDMNHRALQYIPQVYQDVNNLESKIEEFNNITQIMKNQNPLSQEFIDNSENAKKLGKDIIDLYSNVKTYKNNLNFQLFDKSETYQNIQRIDKLTKDNSSMSKKFKSEYAEIRKEFTNLLDSNKPQTELNKLVTRLNELEMRMTATGNTGKSFMAQMSQRLRDINSKYLAQFFSFQDWIRYIRETFQTVLELDTAIVDLSKTTKMTNTELREFYFDANRLAKEMGVTTAEIINQASAFSRLGFSSKEAAESMAELSSKFASISPDMDVSTATDGLVSVMKAFDIEVEDVERKILDNINIVGNTAATSNGEIVDMLMRSSAAMKEANNSLEETIALETAAVEITRNAETTGTAFKTIAMRIRGYDEETEELSADFENIAGDIADLTKTMKTPGGISLFTDENKTEYKSTYQLMKDISEIYDDLTDKQQAELLEKLAGKRGGQVVGSLIGNFEAVENALENMENASGSADREMGKIQNSLAYKINAFKQTWVGMAQELLNRDDVGKFIDNLTKASENFEAPAKSLGEILSTLMYTLNIFADVIGGIVDIFGESTPFLLGGIVLATKNIGMFKTEIDELGNTNFTVFGKTLDELGNSITNVFKKKASAVNLDTDSIEKNTVAQMSQILSTKYATEAELENAIKRIDGAFATEQLSIANKKLTVANIDEAISELKAAEATDTNAIVKNKLAIQDLMLIRREIELREQSKLTTIALNGLKAAAGMVVLWTATKVIELVVKKYDDWKNRVENTKKAVEDLISTEKQALDTANSHAKATKEIIDEFDNLSKGVNNLGQNISLSSDEFDRYHEITNKIADMFPNMVSGWDAEGNAIINLKNNVQELTQAYEDERDAAYKTIIATGKDYNNNDIIKQWHYLNDSSIFEKASVFSLKDKSSTVQKKKIDDIILSSSTNEEFINRLTDFYEEEDIDVQSVLKYLNDTYDFNLDYGGNGGKGKRATFWFKNNNTYITRSRYQKEAQANKDKHQAEIDNSLSSIKELATAYMLTGDNKEIYNNLGESGQNLASIFIRNINEEVASGFNSQKDVDIWVTDLLDKISTGIDENGNLVSDQLNALFSLDLEKMALDDSIAYVEMYIESIAEALKVDITWLRNALGLDVYEDTKSRVISATKSQFTGNEYGQQQRANYVYNTYLSNMTREESEQWIKYVNQLEEKIDNAEELWNGYQIYLQGNVINTTKTLSEWYKESSKILSSEPDANTKSYYTWAEAIEEYKNEIQSLYDIVNSPDQNISDLIGKYSESKLFRGLGLNFEEYLNKYGDNEKEAVKAYIRDVQKAFIAQMGDTSFVDNIEYVLDSINNVTSKYTWNFDFGLTGDYLTDLNKLSNGLDQLDKIYADVYNKKDFDWSSILGNTNFTETFEGLNSYENFITTISNSPKNLKACQEAFNQLTTEYVSHSRVLSELTEENKTATVLFLKQKGIVNAQEVVEKALATQRQRLAKYQEEWNEAVNNSVVSSKNLLVASAEEINALMTEEGTFDDTTAAMVLYYYYKKYAGNLTLMTDGDVNNLNNLIDALGETTDAFDKYVKYRAKLAQLTTMTDEEIAKLGFGNWKRTVQGATELMNQSLKDANTEVTNVLNTRYDSEMGLDLSNLIYGGGESTRKEKQSHDYFDFIEIAINRLEREITNLGKVTDATYKTWEERNTSLVSEMSKVRDEINLQQQAYQAYMKAANSVGLSDTYKKLIQNGGLRIENIQDDTLKQQISDYQNFYEKAIACSDAIQDLNGNLADLAQKKFGQISTQYESRLNEINHFVNLLNGQIQAVETSGKIVGKSFYKALISQETDRLNQLESKYSSLTNSLADALSSGAIQYGSEQWANMRDQINQVEEEIQNSENQILEYGESIKNVIKEIFDYLEGRYSSLIGLIENRNKITEAIISLIETSGHIASSKYYEAEMEILQAELDAKYVELEALQKTVKDGLDDGSLEKYDERWIEMTGTIEDTLVEITQLNQQIIEMNNNIRQASWDLFDRALDTITKIVDESKFLIDIMNYNKLFDDYGNFNDRGLATQGLTVTNYQIYMKQAQEYADEIKKINEDLAKDPSNTTLIDRKQALIEAQQTAITNAKAEKEAIKSLAEEGYNILINKINELISKYEKALDAEKDLYDYEKNVKEQTENISKLQNQIIAYQGDDSEETRTTIQKLGKDLKEAQEQLQETEYQQWRKDQQSMLDNMTDDIQEWVNARLDDIDGLLNTAINVTNENSELINTTIQQESENLGYSISESLYETFNSGTFTLENVKETIMNLPTTLDKIINSSDGQLNAINNNINKLETTLVNYFNTNGNLSSYFGSNTIQSIIDAINNLKAQVVETGNAIVSMKQSQVTSTNVSSGGSSGSGTVSGNTGSGNSSGSGGNSSGGSSSNNSGNQNSVHNTVTTYITKNASSQAEIDRYAAELRKQYNTVTINSVKTDSSGRPVSVQFRVTKVYAKGTKNAARGLNLVGEAGRELYIDKDGNVSLVNAPTMIPMNGGETVIKNSDTEKILDNYKSFTLPSNMQNFVNSFNANGIISSADTSSLIRNMIPKSGISNNNTSIGDINITLPNVTNKEEFVSWLKTDGQITKIIQTMTIGQALGGNKYSHRSK